MQTRRGIAYGLGVTALLGTGLLVWTHATPAGAQDQPPPPGGPGGRMRMMGGFGSVAASGDYVYVLRGPTLYQFKAADLSLVSQKDLPAPGPPPAPPGDNGNGQ